MASKTTIDLRVRISEHDEFLWNLLKPIEAQQQRAEVLRRLAVIGSMRQAELKHGSATPIHYPSGPAASVQPPIHRTIVQTPEQEAPPPTEFDEDDISKLFSEDILKE